MNRKILVSLAMLSGLGQSACSNSDSNTSGGKVQFTASGEVLALGGYGFPPATADDPAFADGWEVKFSKLLVTVDHITLSENPDVSPSDQSKTGKKVAQVDGPWAIDLHQGGPLEGKGGNDSITGGDGTDSYRYTSGDGADTVNNVSADSATDTLLC